MPEVHEPGTEQPRQIARRLADLVHTGEALPVLRLKFVPQFGSRTVEVSYLAPDRSRHPLARLSSPPTIDAGPPQPVEVSLVSACLENGPGSVIVDLSRIPFVNSPGLGLLVSLHCLVTRLGGAMALLCPSRRVLAALQTTQLDKVLCVFDSEDQALSALLGPDGEADSGE